ncbi:MULTISPECIES: hypothetical protein [unclassified Mucilaginibacter]|uniref:hypothetical protein n=1 Tax=unclassified Mucilaginibacter TaxID=2617802 RepID=UPI003392E898
MNKIELEHRFNELFANEGGEMPELSLAVHYATIIDMYNAIEYANTYLVSPPTCYIGFVSNGAFAAKIFKDEDVCYIGINHAVIIILFEIFNRFLCNKQVIYNLGNAENEINIERINNAQITSLLDLKAELGGIERAIPKDPLRQTAATVLSWMACRSILYHEYAHAICGHLDFLHLTLKQNLSLTNSEYQALEYDADRFAVFYGLRILDNYLINIENQSNETKPLFENRHKSTYLLAFATYTTFRLFGMKQFPISNYRSSTHPPIEVRQVLVCMNIAEQIELADGTEDGLKIAWSAANEVEKAFDLISEQGFNNKAFISANSEEAESYVVGLRDQLLNMKERLKANEYLYK